MKKLSVVSISLLVVLLNASPLLIAKELAGVEIEEVITVSPGGEKLRLRGTAVKNNAAQAVYVGGLYLQNDVAGGAKEILENQGAKRFVIYCKSSTIKPEALIRALNLGLTANHNEEELSQLEPMVSQFNSIWNTEIEEGDVVWIDYVPERGTLVTINEEEKGLIPGEAFYKAFLKTWIGSKPLNSSMKKQLLGDE